MTARFIPIRPASENDYMRCLVEAVDACKWAYIRLAFAFVSRSGAIALLSNLRRSTVWGRLRKQFIVGISQGISEPDALRRFSALPKTECRMFVPGRRLDRNALLVAPFFHPKVVYLKASNRVRRGFILASSANLTGAAVGEQPRNYEFGIAVSAGSQSVSDLAAAFEPWWRDAWRISLPVTAARLRKYAILRRSSFRRNPDSLALVERPTSVQDATDLWIEVGMASGIERHQVEFNESLASFFGKVVRGKTILTLESDGECWDDRPLTHKRTTYGVDIWRLGMPTIRRGGVPIQNRVIRFARTEEAFRFVFQVTDADSADAQAWEEEASLHGHIGRTGGVHGRRYGII